LLALAEQEVAQRERNRIARRIKSARFPVLKELADFDFSCITRVESVASELPMNRHFSNHRSPNRT
jgi:DNA replication protein DnaC